MWVNLSIFDGNLLRNCLYRCLDECINSQMATRYDEACVESCMADTPDDYKMWAHDWWVCS